MGEKPRTIKIPRHRIYISYASDEIARLPRHYEQLKSRLEEVNALIKALEWGMKNADVIEVATESWNILLKIRPVAGKGIVMTVGSRASLGLCKDVTDGLECASAIYKWLLGHRAEVQKWIKWMEEEVEIPAEMARLIEEEDC